ncbi:MAG: MBL fold metallo-hydrolase [Trebonia sp.]
MGEASGSIGIGRLTVTSVIDGFGETNAAEFWSAVADVTGFDERAARPRGEWRGFKPLDWVARPESADARGKIRMEVGGYLIRGWDDRVVLVDAGIGPVAKRVLAGGALLTSLLSAGVRPEDVTDLVFSHLHEDHIGWAWQQDRLTFPRATVWAHQKDWDFFVTAGGGQRQAPQLRPLEPRLELWDSDFTLLPGLDLVHAPGHTPGSAIAAISSGTSRAMLLGDTVHCPAELLDEEWAGLGDMDPDLADRTRRALARELEDGETLIGAAHFPGLRFGRLVTGHGKSSWTTGS